MTQSLDLEQASHHLRLLADSTRLRLLALLDREELSVAELAAITQLAQPRVSTHLAKLKEAGLVNDRREGVSVYYRMATGPAERGIDELWKVLSTRTDDPLMRQDFERMPMVLSARGGASSWADSVAGDMERHYSPGRTWEATAKAMAHLLDLGDVLDVASGDGVLAELLAPHARSIQCFDISERVVEAGRQRLSSFENVRFELGDMHELPVAEASFDVMLLMHALTYTRQPGKVFAEAARVLRPGGRLLAVTLQSHQHEKAVQPYNHENLGFSVNDLETLCDQSGLKVGVCSVATIEKRSPNFAVLTLVATRP
jgi:ArsR family transcriptional regulator